MEKISSKPSYFKQVLPGAPTTAILPEKMTNRDNWKGSNLKPLLTNAVLNDDRTKPRILAKMLILELKLESVPDVNDLISLTDSLFKKSKVELVQMLKDLGGPVPKRFKIDIIAQVILVQRRALITGQSSSSSVMEPLHADILEITETFAAMTPTNRDTRDSALSTSVWEQEDTILRHTGASSYREEDVRTEVDLSAGGLVSNLNGDGPGSNNDRNGIAFDGKGIPRFQFNASTPISSPGLYEAFGDMDSEAGLVAIPVHKNMFDVLEVDLGTDEW